MVHGFSKSFALTGWRLGYLAAAPAFIKAINKIQGQASGNASIISQLAGLAALENLTISRDFLRELKKRRELVLYLLTKASALKAQAPDGAFYIFIDIRKITGDSEKFCARLLEEKRVALVPGEAFGAPGFVRLSFAAEEKVLKEGIKRINEFTDRLNKNTEQ